jgi:hypothetical protein
MLTFRPIGAADCSMAIRPVTGSLRRGVGQETGAACPASVPRYVAGVAAGFTED